MCIRDRFRTLLNAIGAIGILLALAPCYNGEAHLSSHSQAVHVAVNPDDVPVREEFKLGWSRSPLVYYRYESTLTDEEGEYQKRQTRELKIGWASLSSLTLAIGLMFLWVGSLLRSKPQPESFE